MHTHPMYKRVILAIRNMVWVYNHFSKFIALCFFCS